MRIKYLPFLLGMLLCGLMASPLISQASINEIIITRIEADPEQFPEVTVHMRILDSSGMPVSNIALGDLSVTEGGTTVQRLQGPRTSNDNGMWIHFVINAGQLMQGTVWRDTQAGILGFLRTQPWAVEGDHVALSAIVESRLDPLVPFTTDLDSVIRSVENYSPPCRAGSCGTRPLIALDSLVNRNVWDQDELRNQPRAIVLFTGRIENNAGGDTALNRLIETANALDVPVYTVIVDGNAFANRLADLAEQTGGTAVIYENANTTNELYRQIVDRFRPQIAVSYRSTDGQDSERVVKVSSAQNMDVSGTEGYEVDGMSDPGLTIVLPAENATVSAAAEDSVQVVSARVVFRNYPSRQLALATLQVGGTQAASIPNPDNEFQFKFPWELINEAGDYELVVNVTDELGREASRSVFVRAEPLPPTVVPPTVTATASTNSTITEDGVTATPTPAVTTGGRRDLSLILVAVFGVVFIAYIALSWNKGPVAKGRYTIKDVVQKVTRRIRDIHPKAYLEIIAGEEPKKLEVFGTERLGRDLAFADVLFHLQHKDSPISHLHCTILDEEDHFLIRDESSTNGTYLNGLRLSPMEKYEISDGDEIELARVERGGVKLIFTIADTPTLMDDDKGETVRVGKLRESNQGEEPF